MGDNPGQGGGGGDDKEVIPLADFGSLASKPRSVMPLAIAAFVSAFVGALIGVKFL